MSMKTIGDLEISKTLQRSKDVTIDLTKRVIRLLPISQPEQLVEIPNADVPSDESLDIRCKSF